jgi:site-specific DNA-methyltransferase (adenine-specific)
LTGSSRLKPAFKEMFRVLRRDGFAVSFYGWPHVDRFMQAWREAGFRIAGHFVFPKRYTSSEKYLRYQHECAYLLVKGNPLGSRDDDRRCHRLDL